jgi:hypothetical protein
LAKYVIKEKAQRNTLLSIMFSCAIYSWMKSWKSLK